MSYLTNLFRALDLGSFRDLVLRLLSVLLCLTVHETCHGLAAYALGDPTAKRQHRLSLNPLRHIDWFGFVMLVLAGFGWAKPVPVNPNYFKKPKQGMALTALAGPLSNMVLALVLLLAVRLLLGSALMTQGLLTFLASTALLSIGLGLFNLIPIPPLDGSKVLFAVLPDRQYNLLMRYERYGMLLLLALVMFGAGGSFLSKATYAVFQLFCRVVGL
ncbi:MAG: site-2 protease family protein [Selenomonas sp.]|nr:site-2 protease family protein [Selenomonas sp.]